MNDVTLFELPQNWYDAAFNDPVVIKGKLLWQDLMRSRAADLNTFFKELWHPVSDIPNDGTWCLTLQTLPFINVAVHRFSRSYGFYNKSTHYISIIENKIEKNTKAHSVFHNLLTYWNYKETELKEINIPFFICDSMWCRKNELISALENSVWISINKRLPQRNGYYLTKTEFYSQEYILQNFSNNRFDNPDITTHWLPIIPYPEGIF